MRLTSRGRALAAILVLALTLVLLLGAAWYGGERQCRWLRAHGSTEACR